MEMERQVLKATELRLGLPGSDVVEPQKKWTSNNKRSSSQMDNDHSENDHQDSSAPPTKQQVVGWPPVRSYRKNTLQQQMKKEGEGCGAMYVKVSVDGAPFLRKIDVKVYNNYSELLKALDNMFKCNIGISEFAVTYEDKDGDWMLAGDVPWDMFVTSCKRLRIMKASDAKGLGCL